MHCSIDKLSHFTAELLDSGRQAHVHKFSLSVHLEAAHNRGIHSEFELDFFARVLRVCLKSGEHFVLLATVEGLGRDDGNLFLLV